jgi:hypothetical protein
LTSDAGLLLPRELDERLGPNTVMGRPRTDPRIGHNRQFPLRDLFRQPIDTRLAGYENTTDAERLAEDPAFWMLASRDPRETSIAHTLMRNWCETRRRSSSARTRGPPIELDVRSRPCGRMVRGGNSGSTEGAPWRVSRLQGSTRRHS